jgi:hypothetical protein
MQVLPIIVIQKPSSMKIPIVERSHKGISSLSEHVLSGPFAWKGMVSSGVHKRSLDEKGTEQDVF